MADGLSGSAAMEAGQQAVQGFKKVVNPFVAAAKQQITGKPPTSPTQGMPQGSSSQPPSEVAPQQPGGFDFANMFDEKDPFGAAAQNSQAQQQQQNDQTAMQNKAEDNAKIEQLRKQLHGIYYEDFVKKAEGKDQKKEEPVAEKLEQEEQEKKQKEMQDLEEKKKKEEVPLAFRKKSTGETGRAKG